MLNVHELVVSYGSVRAVDGLSLAIPRGAMYGLLGPNGAGKTTTISAIGGLVRPTSGRIEVDGLDVTRSPHEVRSRIGVVPQRLALYDDLSVLENLRLFGGLFGLSAARLKQRVDWGLQLAQLSRRGTDRVGALSGGMKRRLNLACSMLHEPQLLICDEPTTGVDPQSRNHLFETIASLRGQGVTVIYTTHYMEEVQTLCDHVAIVDHGKLIADDSLEALLAGKDSLEQVFLDLTGRALRDGPASADPGPPEHGE